MAECCMTSAVAFTSSAATSSALSDRTRGLAALGVVDASDLAIRVPRSVPVASRITTFDSCSDDLVRDASTLGRMMTVPMTTGPRIVAKMNHLDRTRSRYSRLKTTQALPMAGHPRLDAGGADALEE